MKKILIFIITVILLFGLFFIWVVNKEIKSEKSELKEKIFSEENNESFNNIKKPIVNRPNIDNLIKRIINERKKQKKIHLFTVLVFLSVISASAMYYVNN